MVIFKFQVQDLVDFKFLVARGFAKNLKNPKRSLFILKSLVLCARANINVDATATLHNTTTCNLSLLKAFSSSH